MIRPTFERQLLLFVGLALLLPLALLAFYSRSWRVVAIAVLSTIIVAYYMRRFVVHRLRIVSGLIGALREQDYSMRLRGAPISQIGRAHV